MPVHVKVTRTCDKDQEQDEQDSLHETNLSMDWLCSIHIGGPTFDLTEAITKSVPQGEPWSKVRNGRINVSTEHRPDGKWLLAHGVLFWNMPYDY
jgi:hypothetical protein